jgi:hypothetical protein
LPLQLANGKIDLSAFGVNPNMCAAAGDKSGVYYQVTSQFPGQGPCYPVWVQTIPYFNRCGVGGWVRVGGCGCVGADHP